jgi:copper chaperone
MMNMQKMNLQVEGMTCGHCVSSVEGAVRNLGATAKVDLANKTVAIQYDEASVSAQAIKEAIEEQGYDVV